MESEFARWPHYYPDMELEVFAPEWYFKGHTDEYSEKILSSKNNNESEYFIPKIKDLIDELKKSGKLGKIDLIATIPKSDLTYSSTLSSTASWTALYLKTKHENIIERLVSGRRNVRGNGAEKRFHQTDGSMKLKRKLESNEKNILLLDDIKTTGMTLLECAKILKEGEAEKIFCICLGISRNLKMFPLKKGV